MLKVQRQKILMKQHLVFRMLKTKLLCWIKLLRLSGKGGFLSMVCVLSCLFFLFHSLYSVPNEFFHPKISDHRDHWVSVSIVRSLPYNMNLIKTTVNFMLCDILKKLNYSSFTIYNMNILCRALQNYNKKHKRVSNNWLFCACSLTTSTLMQIYCFRMLLLILLFFFSVKLSEFFLIFSSSLWFLPSNNARCSQSK